MRSRRLIVIICLILITIGCYIFMNRNYDPLSRYPYQNKEARELILEYLDEREIKYIVKYEIDPNEFIKYIDAYEFNAFNIDSYKTASSYLTQLTPSQVVNVVERMISKKYDFDVYLTQFSSMNYEEIMYFLVNGYK